MHAFGLLDTTGICIGAPLGYNATCCRLNLRDMTLSNLQSQSESQSDFIRNCISCRAVGPCLRQFTSVLTRSTKANGHAVLENVCDTTDAGIVQHI